VEFSLAEDASEAIENMDQAELYGRVIKVNPAKSQKDANEGLGSRTAVWEQVRLIVALDTVSGFVTDLHVMHRKVMHLSITLRTKTPTGRAA
jgi:RNA recognition motif-containing protein